MDAHVEVLPNGTRVVLAPCEAQSVAFGVFVASGSRHETKRTAGMSHFIEHMLFKGTPTRTPLDITRAIEGRGGNFNACTGEESTVYFAHLPYEYLGEAVDILADMYLHAAIPADEFAREKEVVLEEIKMYADEPDAVAMERLQRGLFPKNPLGAPVAGSAASLRPLAPDDLKRYIASHYTPANTVLVVVGRFDARAARTQIGRAFAADARRGASAARRLRARPVDFSVPTAGELTLAKDINQTQLALGYRTFGVTDPRRYAASVVDAILGRGMMSRLFQEVREKRGLSYDISSRMQFFADAGLFSVTAGLDAAKARGALATIDREIAKLCARGVSAAELRRTQEFMIGNFRLSQEKMVTRMFHLGSTLLAFGRPVGIEEQIAAVRAVTPGEVRAVAREMFRPENRCVSWVVPKR